MSAKRSVYLVKETFSHWMEDNVSRLAAALAYYTVFSIAPLLVIIIAVLGFVYGKNAAEGQIYTQISGLVGEGSARAIQTMIVNASSFRSGVIATAIGIITLLVGATGVFGELQDGLDTIWEVKPKPRGFWGMIRDRFSSFAMILVIAFLLLVSLVLSAAIAAVSGWFGNLFPGFAVVLHGVNFIVSFAVVTVLFGAIYKVLPDVTIRWRDVWIGAAVTALLFAIGKLLIGLYIGKTGVASSYGAAGSLVVILVWVYYSTQILFMGAEFTKVYANTYGSRIAPAANAVPVTEDARAQQGMVRSDATKG